MDESHKHKVEKKGRKEKRKQRMTKEDNST